MVTFGEAADVDSPRGPPCLPSFAADLGDATADAMTTGAE